MLKAPTSGTRFFKKIKKLKETEMLSEGLWEYLSKLIPWKDIREDWLTFDSTVIERYGKQEGVKRGYNPKKKGRGSHNPLIGFLNKSKYVVNLWNRPGNVASCNNILGFFEATWQRLKGLISIKGIIADSGFYLREFIELLEQPEAAMLVRVLIYNLFVLFRYEILGQKEKIERLKTMRYKYFVMLAQLGGDGRRLVLRI